MQSCDEAEFVYELIIIYWSTFIYNVRFMGIFICLQTYGVDGYILTSIVLKLGTHIVRIVTQNTIKDGQFWEIWRNMER